METSELSEKSRLILEAIAEGHSYEQILSAKLAATYHEIFHAAAEALAITEGVKHGKTYAERMTEIRQANPRAYEKWSPQEDDKLTRLFRSHSGVGEIARTLQRQPSAIRSRLAKLNLTEIKQIAA